MHKECPKKWYTKFGGTTRHRFFAVCEKPGGGGVADIGPHAGHAGAGAILTEVSIFEEKKVTGCIAKCL